MSSVSYTSKNPHVESNAKESHVPPSFRLPKALLNSLRLLVVAAHEGHGTVHIDKLLPTLHEMGVRVSFIGWDRLHKLPRSFTEKGVLYRMIFRGWGYANRRLLLALPLWMMRCGWFALWRRPSLFMALDFDTGFPIAVATRLTRVPFIYNVRDNYAMRASVPQHLRPLITALDRWVIRCAIRVIVPDEIRITETDPQIRHKFVVVDNGALDIAPVTSEAISSESQLTVYAMGYLRESRGIAMLLDAAECLPWLRVVLAGNAPEPELEERFYMSPNVDFRGFLPVEEALQLCFQSHVIFTFYKPDSEINRLAVSNKWSDAMMAARPILVNSEVKKSQWIEREGIGYTCPYNLESLIETLEKIRSQPEAAREKGAAGRRLFDKGYSWEAAQRRIHSMMEEIRQEIRVG